MWFGVIFVAQEVENSSDSMPFWLRALHVQRTWVTLEKEEYLRPNA
jgi:hypothetical protein